MQFKKCEIVSVDDSDRRSGFDLPSLSGPTLLLESAFGFSGVMPPSPYKAA